MSEDAEKPNNRPALFGKINEMFFIKYFAINIVVVLVLGLAGILPNADQYAWIYDPVGSFGASLGATVGLTLVPALIFGAANIVSTKWKKRTATGWWLVAPTIIIYALVVLGYLRGA